MTAPLFFVMTLDLLDAPLRVTWDLHGPEGPAADAALAAVGRALVDAGVFFVFLERQPLRHPRLDRILEQLAAGGCRVTAVCEGSPAELDTLSQGLPLAEVLLDAGVFVPAGGGLEGLARAVDSCRSLAVEPGLMLVPDAGNLEYIQRLADFCRELGLERFKLPNLRNDASLEPGNSAVPLGPGDLERFRCLLGGQPEGLARDLALEVHDLFLWELIFPDGGGSRSEYGGCQAGNSLAHVDARGDLFPCTSWPERLGSLLQESLGDLWASPQRLALRDRIGKTPEGCLGCRDLPVCFGGCRGLSASGFGREGRDPGCSGPR